MSSAGNGIVVRTADPRASPRQGPVWVGHNWHLGQDCFARSSDRILNISRSGHFQTSFDISPKIDVCGEIDFGSVFRRLGDVSATSTGFNGFSGTTGSFFGWAFNNGRRCADHVICPDK